jgi:hypothetical protein
MERNKIRRMRNTGDYSTVKTWDRTLGGGDKNF